MSPVRWIAELACDMPGCDTDVIANRLQGLVFSQGRSEGWEQERCSRGHITGLWHCPEHITGSRPPCPQAHGYPDEAAWQRRPRARRLR